MMNFRNLIQYSNSNTYHYWQFHMKICNKILFIQQLLSYWEIHILHDFPSLHQLYLWSGIHTILIQLSVTQSCDFVLLLPLICQLVKLQSECSKLVQQRDCCYFLFANDFLSFSFISLSQKHCKKSCKFKP